MTHSIDLAPDHYKIISDILRKHVPGRKIMVFGSRAKGTPKKTSDLDLCIMGENRLSNETLSDLAKAFDEAPIPFKVDVVEWVALEKYFQDIVHSDGVKL